MDGTSALVIVVFLAAAIERTVEAITSPLFDRLGWGEDPVDEAQRRRRVWPKRLVGVVLGLGAGFAIAFGLQLDLFNALLDEQALSSLHAKIFTGILLGGGSAPAHELIRYVEEKKDKAKTEAKDKRLALEAKLRAGQAGANPQFQGGQGSYEGSAIM